MRRRRLAAVVVATGLLAACGTDRDGPPAGVAADGPRGSRPALDPALTVPRAQDIGACPPHLERNADTGTLDSVPLRERLASPDLRWWRVDRLEQPAGVTATTTPQDRSIAVTLVGTRSVGPGGAAPDSARVYGPSWPQVVLAQDSGYGFYVARRQSSGFLESVAAVDGEGRFGFVGQCEVVMSTVTMAAFVEAVRDGEVAAGVARDAAPEAVLAAVFQPGSTAASAFATWGRAPVPSSWLDLSADRRSIDPDTTPAEVMATLRPVPVAVALPAEWRGRRDVTVCTRTAYAWGECTALDAGAAGEPLRVVGYVRQGEGFEVWALDGAGTFEQPIGALASVSAGLVDERLATGKGLTFRPAPSVDSLDALLAAARESRPALVEG